MMLVICAWREPSSLPSRGDGSSSVLVWMSPTWQLWDDAPTYVAGALDYRRSLRPRSGWPVWQPLGSFPATRRSLQAGSAALIATNVRSLRSSRLSPSSAALPLDATRRAVRSGGARAVSDAGDLQHHYAPRRREIRPAVGRQLLQTFHRCFRSRRCQGSDAAVSLFVSP